MSHPSEHDTTTAAAALSPEDASADAILDRLDEAAFYQAVFLMIADDPYAAQNLLLQRNADPHYGAIREGAFAALKLRTAAAQAVLPTGADAPGGAHDQAREASFRANPGRYIEGAEPAPVQQLRPDGFGYVLLDGLVYPWTYGTRAYLHSDLRELKAFAHDRGYHRGILVGEADLKDGLDDFLPDGFLFAPVSLEFFDVGRTA